jgi:cobalt/nickel transport system permease protein
VSSLPVSSHIPDLDLITWYAERRESFLSRVSPWTKVLFLAVLVIAITVSRNLGLLLLLYLAVLALFILARLPVRKLFAWCFFPLLFVLSLVGVLAWTQPGHPLVGFTIAGFPVSITDQGLLLVLTLAVKTLVSVTYSLLLLMTTRYEHLSGMISRVFPAPIDQIFLMAYRFFFLTLAMLGSILKAVRSRGGSLVRGFLTESALFAEIFGLVFIRSLDRAERVHKAMIARGYQGTYGSNTEIPVPGIAEAGALMVLSLILAVASLVSPMGGWP